jgi:succinoglycan biosynthesis protein ExoV
MLYYCKLPEGNFGDDLNPWLWSRLAPEACDERDPTLFIGIGTILSRHVPAEPTKVVFGAGYGYSRPPVLDDRWVFYGVRGPLTAARLHLDPSLALSDPALLVRRVSLPAPKKVFPVSFMPHHQSLLKADWESLCGRTSIHFIDPRGRVEQVLSEIQQTSLLLAEAMHGAIVADALRVPWIPLRIYSQFLEFKWRDWTESIQVPLKLATVPPIFSQGPGWRKAPVHLLKKGLAKAGLGKEKWHRLALRASNESRIGSALRALESLTTRHPPCLSTDRTIAELESRMVERLSKLREDWRSGRLT